MNKNKLDHLRKLDSELRSFLKTKNKKSNNYYYTYKKYQKAKNKIDEISKENNLNSEDLWIQEKASAYVKASKFLALAIVFGVAAIVLLLCSLPVLTFIALLCYIFTLIYVVRTKCQTDDFYYQFLASGESRSVFIAK